MSATVFQRTDHRARPAWHKKSSRARARTNEQALKPAASDAGNAVKGSGNFGETSRRSEQIGFTGRYLDKETGLYYFRARYYSGSLGRFIGRDPIKYKGGGYNLYSGYFIPNKFDPLGLSPVTCRGIGVDTPYIKKTFNILVAKLDVDFQGSMEKKKCTQCCSSGSRKGQTVEDDILEGKWSVSVGAQGGTYPFSAPGLSGNAGIILEAYGAGSGSGKLETDKCNNVDEQRGKVCGSVEAAGSVSGGIWLEFSAGEGWWEFHYTTGVKLTGEVKVTFAEVCWSPSSGWDLPKANLCGAIKFNFFGTQFIIWEGCVN